jgi:hypothetical protein
MTFVTEKPTLGAGFLRVLQFLLSILIPPTAPLSAIILSSTLHSLDSDSVYRPQSPRRLRLELSFPD